MKRSFTNANDWNKYNENVSDFLKHVSCSKKKDKRGNQKGIVAEQNISNSSFLIDEGNISWTQSDDENLSKHDGNLRSPVIADCKRFLSTDGQCVKSTPAGSPILLQNNLISEKVLVSRRRRLSLVPLSPITPGVSGDFSFPNSSHFSFSIHEESKVEAPSYDQTPLALPLPDSDEEAEVEDYDQSFTSSANRTATQNDIEAIPTQITNTSDSPHFDSEGVVLSNEADEDTVCADNITTETVSKARGSEWLENIMGKFDGEGQTSEFRTSAMPSSLFYDSTKKLKFVRNGMAARLKRILKQEQTQKVLFNHQLKELKKVEHKQPCLKLKVVSHHKDGPLHVLECKVLSKGKLPVEKKGFCTVILNNEDVARNKLDLMSVFTIYPPWREIRVEQHDFPILICVYHIVVHSEGNISAATSQTEESQEGFAPVEPLSNWTKDCESLLEALEKQSTDCGICLVATVQRQYQQQTPAGIRKTWLCEDAFGVFFELTLESSLGDDVNWLRMIEHGEGQRIYFQKIFLIGRTTRDRSPGLFNLIDSVWDNEGFGLLQVQNSQSQELSDSENLHLVQAPSFCYRFTARRWQSACCSSSVLEGNDVTMGYSEINRPRLNGAAHTDVLYKPCEILTCAKAAKHTADIAQRISLFGFVLHVHCNKGEPFCDVSFSTSSSMESKLLFLVDESASAISGVVSVIINLPHSNTNMGIGDIILVKDVLYDKGGGFRADFFSNLVVLSQSSFSDDKFQISDAFPSHVYPGLSDNLRCSEVKISSFPHLKKDQEPDCFAKIGGIICGFSLMTVSNPTASLSRDELSDQERMKLITKKSSCEDYAYEVLVMVSLNVKVKIKMLRNTAEQLMAKYKLKALVGASVLNGKNLVPVNCYVYAKYVKTHFTLFYAEETTGKFF